MAKSNLKIKERKAKSDAKLKIVDDSAIKTTSYSDINLKQWKNYDHIKTDTLWEFPSRLKEGGHTCPGYVRGHGAGFAPCLE